MVFQKGRAKVGGRQKGTPNKATRERQEAVAASGVTPLEYMLEVMRDKTADYARRDEMAKSAAPYVHPKLAATTHTGPDGGPIQTEDVTQQALIEALVAFRERKKS